MTNWDIVTEKKKIIQRHLDLNYNCKDAREKEEILDHSGRVVCDVGTFNIVSAMIKTAIFDWVVGEVLKDDIRQFFTMTNNVPKKTRRKHYPSAVCSRMSEWSYNHGQAEDFLFGEENYLLYWSLGAGMGEHSRDWIRRKAKLCLSQATNVIAEKMKDSTISVTLDKKAKSRVQNKKTFIPWRGISSES
jgi:hypothetical protein